MALRYISVSSSGTASESLNNTTSLTTAITDAITATGVANAVAGANADVTTELGTITSAVEALSANIPSNGIVCTINTSVVTTRNKLRQLLDSVYDHMTSTNLIT